MNRFGLTLLAVAALGTLTGCATGGACAPHMQGETMSTGFINKTMNIDGKDRRYVVYVPFDYTPEKQWPVILFLHGAGERGDNGLFQSDVGIGRAISQWPERFPCLVVMPQCPNDVWWDAVLPHAELALQQTLSEYNVDPAREYLTGLSMGGYGTWLLGARDPGKYAALMPICGGGDPADAPQLAKTPIWAFHGAKDSVVNVDESRKMVDAVKKAGGNIQFTEYPDLDHNSWDATYSNPDAIAWLLNQRKDGK